MDTREPKPAFLFYEILSHAKPNLDCVNTALLRDFPGSLPDWTSIHTQVLLNKITDFQEILPLIENLRKPSIKPRHWQEVMAITKTTFPYESETFSLAHIMDSPILKFKDDVEEVSWGHDQGYSYSLINYIFPQRGDNLLPSTYWYFLVRCKVSHVGQVATCRSSRYQPAVMRCRAGSV